MERQRRNAEITFQHYKKNRDTEAFCQEHAEIVLHRLALRGEGEKSLMLKIYDVASQDSHILVLFANVSASEALELFRPLAESRRTAPLTIQPAGMELENFVNYLSRNAPKLWIIDAWSSTKVLAFSKHCIPESARNALNPLIMEGLRHNALQGTHIKVEALKV